MVTDDRFADFGSESDCAVRQVFVLAIKAGILLEAKREV